MNPVEKLHFAFEFLTAYKENSDMTMDEFLNWKGITDVTVKYEMASAIAEELARQAVILEDASKSVEGFILKRRIETK